MKGGHLPQTHLLVPSRGKKFQKKKNFVKGSTRSAKDFAMRLEVERLLMKACVRTSKFGEPLDPEMLNPARERDPSSISPDEEERRILLVKQWQKASSEKHKEEHKFLQETMKARKKALLELRKVSLPLFKKALELQPNLFPLDCRGPTETPPIPGYIPPEPDE